MSRPSLPEVLRKNWVVKVLLAVLLSLPAMVVAVDEVLAEERTALFWRCCGRLLLLVCCGLETLARPLLTP